MSCSRMWYDWERESAKAITWWKSLKYFKLRFRSSENSTTSRSHLCWNQEIESTKSDQNWQNERDTELKVANIGQSG